MSEQPMEFPEHWTTNQRTSYEISLETVTSKERELMIKFPPQVYAVNASEFSEPMFGMPFGYSKSNDTLVMGFMRAHQRDDGLIDGILAEPEFADCSNEQFDLVVANVPIANVTVHELPCPGCWAQAVAEYREENQGCETEPATDTTFKRKKVDALIKTLGGIGIGEERMLRIINKARIEYKIGPLETLNDLYKGDNAAETRDALGAKFGMLPESQQSTEEGTLNKVNFLQQLMGKPPFESYQAFCDYMDAKQANTPKEGTDVPN